MTDDELLAAEYRRMDAEKDAAIAKMTEGTEVGCLFPDSHDPRHPADFRFHILMHHGSGEWEDLTEEEIIGRVKETGHGFSHGSQWDFWWEG